MEPFPGGQLLGWLEPRIMPYTCRPLVPRPRGPPNFCQASRMPVEVQEHSCGRVQTRGGRLGLLNTKQPFSCAARSPRTMGTSTVRMCDLRLHQRGALRQFLHTSRACLEHQNSTAGRSCRCHRVLQARNHCALPSSKLCPLAMHGFEQPLTPCAASTSINQTACRLA